MLYARIRLLDLHVRCCIYVLVYCLLYTLMCITEFCYEVNHVHGILVTHKNLIGIFGPID
jgi:hypothetical protein